MQKITSFLLLAGIFCLMRLVPILTGVERIYHYDELDPGFIALEFLKNQGAFGLWNYQMDPYGGESLVMGLFSAPFIQALGPTLLALKIPALLFSLSTFSLLFFFIKHFFGIQSAVLAGLIQIFCHPVYVQLSLSGMFGHTEALFFALAMLYFFYAFLYKRKRASLSLFLAGFFGGLGFWVYHENIVVIAACLLSWMILDSASFKSRLSLSFLAGTAIGLLPWFGYNFSHGPVESSFLSSALAPFIQIQLYAQTLLKKLIKLLLMGIPFSFVSFPVFGIHERIFSVLYFIFAFLPLVPFALWRLGEILKTKKDEGRLLPLLLIPVILIAVLAISNFDVAYIIGFAGFRYLSPLHLFAFPLPALLLPPGKFKNFMIAAILVIGLAGQTSLFFKEPPARAQSYQGISYHKTGTNLRFCLWPKVKTLEDVKRELGRRDPQTVYYLLWGLVDGAIASREPVLLSNTSISIAEVISAFNAGTMPYLYEWKGSTIQSTEELASASASLPFHAKQLMAKSFFEHWGEFSTLTFTQCPRCFDELGAESDWAYVAFGEFLYYGLLAERAQSFLQNFYGDASKQNIREILAKIRALQLPQEKEMLIYRGLGMGFFPNCWDAHELINRSAQRLLDEAPPQYRPALYWGIGWSLRAMLREDKKRAEDWLETVPSEGRNHAKKGFTAFEELYRLPG